MSYKFKNSTFVKLADCSRNLENAAGATASSTPNISITLYPRTNYQRFLEKKMISSMINKLINIIKCVQYTVFTLTVAHHNPLIKHLYDKC